MNITSALSRKLIFILIISSPLLFFTDVNGFRLIVLLPLVAGLIVLLSPSKYIDGQLITISFIPLYIFLIACAVLTGDTDTLLSATIFFLLIAYPSLLNRNLIKDISVEKLKYAYIYSALIVAIGLWSQYILYKYGINFLRIIQYGGGRTAFSFLWLDFSFVSLFVVSAIPLVLTTKKGFFTKCLVILIMISASLITSARTGVAASLLCIATFILIEIFKQSYKGRANYKIIVSIVFSILSPIALLALNSVLSVREFTASDSGRFDGYYSAIHQFLSGNIFFGEKFDIYTYYTHINIIPHNIILYMLTFGGVVFLLFFLLWLATVLNLFLKVSSDLFYAFITSMLGTLFIPSFFSMYFLSSLIAIALIERRKKLGSQIHEVN